MHCSFPPGGSRECDSEGSGGRRPGDTGLGICGLGCVKVPGQGGVAGSLEQGLLLWQEVSLCGGHSNSSMSLGKHTAFFSMALA